FDFRRHGFFVAYPARFTRGSSRCPSRRDTSAAAAAVSPAIWLTLAALSRTTGRMMPIDATASPRASNTGAAMAPTPSSHSPALTGNAGREVRGELRREGVGAAHGAAGVAFHRGGDVGEPLGRQEGEDRLAGRDRMRRSASADRHIGAHRLRAVDAVDIDHLV